MKNIYQKINICLVLLTAMLALASCSSSNEPQSQPYYSMYRPQHIGDSLVYAQSWNLGNTEFIQHCIGTKSKGKLYYRYYVWETIAFSSLGIRSDTSYVRLDYNGNVYYYFNDSDELSIDYFTPFPGKDYRVRTIVRSALTSSVAAGQFDNCIEISNDDQSDAGSTQVYAPNVGLIRSSGYGWDYMLIYAKIGTKVYP